MKIRGIVKDHRPDAEYKFDRFINNKIWYLSGKSCNWLNQRFPPTATTILTKVKKTRFSDNDHIYSIDTPKFTGSETAPDLLDIVPPADRATLSEAVFMLNATETAKVGVAGGHSIQTAQLEWFSISWLEKVDDVWRRKSGSNRIAVGSIDNLEDADAHNPPTSF